MELIDSNGLCAIGWLFGEWIYAVDDMNYGIIKSTFYQIIPINGK
jgi:hypothetical protein